MLNRLFIQNYILIDELEIRFADQLNVITGETGAGKSIIMGALGLILGERADTGSLKQKDRKCVIEGSFSVPGKKSVSRFLQENELDESAELIVRREISASGKSRAFVNDTPVNLSQLQELCVLLVDLHQQFDTMALSSRDFQREVLDALAGQHQALEEYQQTYLTWKELQAATNRLREQQIQFEKEADYNRFQFDELEEAAFRENELEEAEATLKLLSHAEEVRSGLEGICQVLQENETPLIQQLKTILNQLQHLEGYHPGLPLLKERMQSAQIELQDIAGDLDHISHQVNADPARMEQLSERLSLGYRLQKKHGVSSTHALLDIRQQLEEKLQAVIHTGESIRQMEAETELVYQRALTQAAGLSLARKKQVKPLEEKVNQRLVQVGMPNARLKVELTEEKDLNRFGKNSIIFLFNANLPPGVKETGNTGFAPVNKVASGGELSRLMLCIKSLVAQSADLPTIIFDEIDTGISGEAARQVGTIMKGLSASRQVICITHQPQIAGKANAHFLVYKEISGQEVQTHIRLLDRDERITVIAKMLSGEKPTAAALENAREMIMN